MAKAVAVGKPAIWSQVFVQNQGPVTGRGPIPIVWVIGEKETGKSTFIATVAPVRPGEVTRTLVTDLEMSQETIKTQAPMDTVDVRALAHAKAGKDYTLKDLFSAWLETVMNQPAGKYDVLGVDPVSDLFQGAYMYVGDHAELFGKNAQNYNGVMGVKSQWGDTTLYWKQICLELASRYETVVFTSHIKDVYSNNVKTGSKAARGADLTEIATLVLWLDRDVKTGERWALVKKSRLTWWDWGKPEEERERPILHDLLPRRLQPTHPGQSYPELINSYLKAPQADYGALNEVPHDPAVVIMSEEDKLQVTAAQSEAESIVAINAGRNRLISDLVENGDYQNGAEIAKAVAALNESYTVAGHDALYQKLLAYAKQE